MGSRNILYLIETSGPGGAEKILIDLTTHLDKKKFNPIVGLLKQGWLSKQLESAGIEVISIKQRRSYDLATIAELVSIIRKRDISLIHTHEFMINVYGSIAGIVSRVPVVSTIHGKNYFWKTLQRRLAYRLLSRRSSFVAVSEDLKRFVADKTGIRPSRINVIHNGINLHNHDRPGLMDFLRDELMIPADAPVIGMIGNLYPIKGYNFFLEAASQILKAVPEAVFLIVGRGELLGNLQSQAADLGISEHVKFLGFREDVPDILHLIDIFVLTSIEEGFSLVTVEAMASKKPVVVTRSGGPEEIVEDRITGFLVKPRDPSEVAEKVVSLLRDKKLAKDFGIAGHLRAEQLFSLEKMVSNYQNLYTKLL